MALSDNGAKARKREREKRALTLRKQGASYRDIGDALDVSEKTAYYDVQKALSRVVALTARQAENYRDLELARLDELLFAIWPAATATGSLTNAEASRQALRLSESRRKLLGIDAPTEIKISHNDFVNYARAMLEAVGEVVTDPETRQRIASIVRAKMLSAAGQQVIETRAISA